MSREMKDSKIDWIGEIPEEWCVKPLKAVLFERKEKNNPIKTDFILSLTFDRGVIPYSEKGGSGNKSKEDLTQYKLAYPNDIVLNSMNVVTGSVGLSKYFGAVSPVYYTLYKRNTEESIKYFNYIFQTKEFQESLIGYGNGILVKQSEGLGKLYAVRMRIPMSKLNTVLIACPSPEEQKKIAVFLDKKVAEIDKVIAQTTLSIEEYKKYKQSLITEAVTKGLNPDVEMKDSGIDWIGEIPRRWNVRKIKQLISVLNRPIYEKDGLITSYNDGTVTLRSNRATKGIIVSEFELGFQGVEPNDLVIHGMDAYAGAIGISDSRGKCSPVLHVCDTEENKKYLMYSLRAMAYNKVFKAFSNGIRSNSSDFRNFDKLSFILMVVPTLDEQSGIVKFIVKKCFDIDNLISQKEKLLTELEGYKKSIIYESVTGKRDVN